MCKKILRFLSLALAILLAVSAAVPAPASAAATTADEIKQQIRTTYKNARSYYGKDSFDGYCGALVNAQLYLLGITASAEKYDGKDEYDAYCSQKVTSGGYQVTAYPASRYTLREALYDITDNGTTDAYNILVGFETTKSERGVQYGHACLIHAILDGTVYFMESFDVILDGTTYPEGTPVACSIDRFCQYYAHSTTKADGVIWFGTKTYDVLCESYPANLYAAALTAGELRSQPCDGSVHDSSELIRTLTPGEQLTVTGLYLNTVGEYWYQVDGGYVRAADAGVRQFLFDDVQVQGATAPTVLRQGRAFHVEGVISARQNSIYSVRAQVYSLDDGEMTQVISATAMAEDKSYDLESSEISKKLTFRKLDVGYYRYELAAVVGNYYVEDGQLQTCWDTVTLWSSDFQVAEEKTGSDTVIFDACGGTASVNQTAVSVGSAIGTLPTAQRQGFVFLGWYTDTEGGSRVTEEFVPDDNTTLYAQWSSVEALQSNWQDYGECLYFYSDGMSTMGCIELNGTLYYFSSVDPLGESWMMWTATGTAG